jgi:hypothetical protein
MTQPDTPPDHDDVVALRPANDSAVLFARLMSFAKQGCQSPETLTPYEIEQLSFALLTYLALDEEI